MNKKSLIEALIFTSGKEGVSKEEVIQKLQITDEEFEIDMNELIEYYTNSEERPFFIKKLGNKYKFLTKVEVTDQLFDNTEIKKRNPLNASLMETLAIIAYNAPCTRTKIHDIRKIDPTMQINKLIELGLVKELGRSDARGNPFIYDVTDLFYDTFNLGSLDELPAIKEFNKEDIEDVDFFDSNRDE